MFAGNPIITHKSHIWNAHLEILDPTFSLVADKDNVEQYADHMVKIINLKKSGEIASWKTASRMKAESNFLPESVVPQVEKIIDEVC